VAARKKKKKFKGPFYRINHYIQAREIRVVDEKGKQVGVMALQKALSQAREKGLDLVEVAPLAKPPVCKIVDFKKFKFLENKKRRKEQKKAKRVEIKEVRLTPFIAENDLNFRLERAEEFLNEGDRVKISVFFKGRQMAKKEFGYELIKKTLERLKPIATVEMEPKFVGRRLEMMLSPAKGGPSPAAKKPAPKGKQDDQKKAKSQKVDQKKV
jgi:translation initiation factor IF-3